MGRLGRYGVCEASRDYVRYSRADETPVSTGGRPLHPLNAGSIVFLVDDLLPLQAGGFELLPHIIHHGFHAADVNIDIPSVSKHFENMPLHVSASAGPVVPGTAERRPEIEVGMHPGHVFKLCAIKQRYFVTH